VSYFDLAFVGRGKETDLEIYQKAGNKLLKPCTKKDHCDSTLRHRTSSHVELVRHVELLEIYNTTPAKAQPQGVVFQILPHLPALSAVVTLLLPQHRVVSENRIQKHLCSIRASIN
jgi:hypothetical protein